MPAKADVDLDLSAISAELTLKLDDVTADVGLDDIQISIPKPVTLDLGLDDINAKIALNTGVHVGGELSTKSAVQAQADIGAKASLDAKAHLGIDEIRARLGADANVIAALRELAPVFLNLLWKEVPLVRVGMPHRYKLGLTLLGIEVASLSFCGESEIVTEDNRTAGGGAP